MGDPAHPLHALGPRRIMMRTSLGVALVLMSSVAAAKHVYPKNLMRVRRIRFWRTTSSRRRLRRSPSLQGAMSKSTKTPRLSI